MSSNQAMNTEASNHDASSGGCGATVHETKRALLIDADSVKDVDNIAIGKFLTHYELKGYDVEVRKLGFPAYPHKKPIEKIDASDFDAVRVSILFKRNKDMVKITNCNDVMFGGTGHDLTTKLPPDIGNLDYTSYCNEKERIEFITRGCNETHWFCVVWRKEGKIHLYRSIERILKSYDGRPIRFLDNNFLQYPGHKEILQILVDNQIKCYFDQGLTIGLIDDENANLLSQLNYGSTEYVFAFDDVELQPVIEEKLAILRKYIKGDWKFKFYIFSHAKQPIGEIIYRADWCKSQMVLPYIMRYDNCYTSENRNFYTDLTAWCNQPAQFKKRTFEQFIFPRHPNNTARGMKYGIM